MLVSARLTVPLYAAVLVLTHLTGFQQAMATHMWIHDAELLLYLVSGYLLLLPLAGEELSVEPPWPYGLRLLVLALDAYNARLAALHGRAARPHDNEKNGYRT